MTTAKIYELISNSKVFDNFSVENDSIGYYEYGSYSSNDIQSDYIVGSVGLSISLELLKAKDIVTFFSNENRINILRELLIESDIATGTDIEYDNKPEYCINFKKRIIDIYLNYTASVPSPDYYS